MPVCSIFQTNVLSTVASSGGTWCSEEGAAVTIRLGVTCKQLSVLATLVNLFQKLFYHFQFEYQILERVKRLFTLFFRPMSCRQLPPVVAAALVQWRREQPLPSVSESRVRNFLCLLL